MRESGRHTVDPLADTVRIDLLGDTQPFERPSLGETFNLDDARWFDEGERNAAQEWAELEQRTKRWVRMPFALAFAGSAVLGIFLSVAF